MQTHICDDVSVLAHHNPAPEDSKPKSQETSNTRQILQEQTFYYLSTHYPQTPPNKPEHSITIYHLATSWKHHRVKHQPPYTKSNPSKTPNRPRRHDPQNKKIFTAARPVLHRRKHASTRQSRLPRASGTLNIPCPFPSGVKTYGKTRSGVMRLSGACFPDEVAFADGCLQGIIETCNYDVHCCTWRFAF